ncbi:Bcdga1 [Botrytis cinerea B05.10]|uniref:diacylglycerol O-acyltransferase n=3 Tax=Botryotinia fuckeliana TaxID=40559 RepID=A0A384J4S1_BOTFB|nr:Bcdga1 [Botrytis cinerea B05.10]ATZ45509.1 Bcdga1 [Botrytis cinerea B05.10]EMR80814.1 putative diacylglycerol o-acyltransferase protein [Botrytis cinerea BcDW1]CCD54837.1 similar to diacylglycerol O-acyltransferase 2B [Botrytis cinerea T4]
MSGPTLNPEPALPEEREKLNLPPKSYADAAEETPESPDDGSNENNENRENGVNGQTAPSANGTGKYEPKHKVSVLRIVDTNGSDSTKSADEQDTRPSFDRQESKREYSATGLDDTPKSPPRQRHRKSSSQKSNGSNENGQDANTNTMAHTQNNTKHNTAVFKNEKNGSKLISVKPSGDYEKQLQRDHSEAPKPKDEKLVSGRQAGQRWHTSGIRWAPMNVPLQRRLQTLVVLFHTLCIAIFVSMFFFLCAIPLFWPILIPYMIYLITSKASISGTLSHRSNFFRSLPVWSLFASYFPARLHRTQELPPTRKYIFGYHPHGIISHGAFAAFATEALGFSQLFPGIKNTLLTLDTNFRIPLYREYALAMGLASVSKESCENLLSKGGPNREGMGRAITIVVGGAAESLDAQPYSLRLVLKRRKGFVKMAIRTGADLVPVLAFGENDLYDQFSADSHPWIHKFQLLVKKLMGFTIPLFHARGVFNYDVGLMPYRRPLNIVVGRPIKVIQSKTPEQQDIDRVHEEYVTELERLWDLWKDDFAPNRKGELQLVE